MSKQTPGHWIAVDVMEPMSSKSIGYKIIGPPLRENTGYFDNEADALIMAAAPEMLHQLEWALSALIEGGYYYRAKQIKIILAKARGERYDEEE